MDNAKQPTPAVAADPNAGPVAQFARELCALRDDAGLTVGAIQAKVTMCSSHLYRVMKGQRLPSPDFLRDIVLAIGGDPDEWLAKRALVLADLEKRRVALDTRRCGTTQGWSRHRDRSEKPCDACAAAKAEYDRNWRSAPERTKRQRLHAQAQGRARCELARRYPAEYRRLYETIRNELYGENGFLVPGAGGKAGGSR